MHVVASKSENLSTAREGIKRAKAFGASVVCLPECFTFLYAVENFPRYAESVPGETSGMLSQSAKENGVYLIGGSIAEADMGKLYNTCLVYGPDGKLLAKHRKVHLFDVDIPGKVTFKESHFLTAGDRLTTFDTPYCKVGVGICYDLRFAQLAQLYAKHGCKLLVYPGAFSRHSGSHWELLQRVRAVDNEVYVATASAATDTTAPYVAWGHSMLVDPLGKVVASAGAQEAILTADIDLDFLESVRRQLPIHGRMRTDLCDVVSVKHARLTSFAS
ncbi:hypothetical protein V5799_026243 [Amblyomma americanum]|uniref:omega-amidase n=1 Tax=Amblyomma americanum TaxID=6943 RepID=A0AAQ4DJ50_AMBAM